MQADPLQVMKQSKATDSEDVDKPRVEVQLEEVELAACDNNGNKLQIGSREESSSAIDEKRLIRRIDLTLIPWLGVLYLLCFLDRAGIGNARLYGMEDDLHITDTQYLLCLSLFFIPYAFLEMPANIILKQLKPSTWFATIMLLWGITMTVQGLVHNFGGLLGVRWMLGVFEAGYYPGTAYYLSCWYKRNEIGFRLAIFNSAVTFAGAFGGLLAAAISNMDGVGGKPAWAWIFIIEGLITIAAGFASFFLVQDYPAAAKFLSEEERLFMVRRLQADDQFTAAGEQLRWRSVRKSLADWKTWMGALVVIGTDGPLYALTLFLPSIISQLGFTATRSNLLTVPVYSVACVFACLLGFMADRFGRRGYFAIALSVTTGTAYTILIVSRNPALSYFATFIAAIGIFPGIPNAVAWISNNVEGSYKRSISMAIGITFGNLTGSMTANTYRSRDTPWYTLGHAVTLGFILIGHVGSVAFHFLLVRENKRRDCGERDEVIGDPEKSGGDSRNGCYESVDDAKKDKGDNWSGYRYIT